MARRGGFTKPGALAVDEGLGNAFPIVERVEENLDKLAALAGITEKLEAIYDNLELLIGGGEGPAGTGVESVAIDHLTGHLKVTLTNGVVIDTGRVTGDKGEKGEGAPGDPGVSVTGVVIDADGHAIFTFSDATSIDAGKVVGTDGTSGRGVVNAETNLNGELILTYSDATSQNLGRIIGTNGSNGRGILGAGVNVNGNLVFQYTDGTTQELGRVKGTDGRGITGASLDKDGRLVLSYSDNTTQNLGAVVGKGIQNIAIAPGGVLKITLSDGTITEYGRIVGRGVTDARIDKDGNLAIQFDDGTSYVSGSLMGPPGLSVKGDPGKDAYSFYSTVPVTLVYCNHLGVMKGAYPIDAGILRLKLGTQEISLADKNVVISAPANLTVVYDKSDPVNPRMAITNFTGETASFTVFIQGADGSAIANRTYTVGRVRDGMPGLPGPAYSIGDIAPRSIFDDNTKWRALDGGLYLNVSYPALAAKYANYTQVAVVWNTKSTVKTSSTLYTFYGMAQFNGEILAHGGYYQSAANSIAYSANGGISFQELLLTGANGNLTSPAGSNGTSPQSGFSNGQSTLDAKAPAGSGVYVSFWANGFIWTTDGRNFKIVLCPEIVTSLGLSTSTSVFNIQDMHWTGSKWIISGITSGSAETANGGSTSLILTANTLGHNTWTRRASPINGGLGQICGNDAAGVVICTRTNNQVVSSDDMAAFTARNIPSLNNVNVNYTGCLYDGKTFALLASGGRLAQTQDKMQFAVSSLDTAIGAVNDFAYFQSAAGVSFYLIACSPGSGAIDGKGYLMTGNSLDKMSWQQVDGANISSTTTGPKKFKYGGNRLFGPTLDLTTKLVVSENADITPGVQFQLPNVAPLHGTVKLMVKALD